MASRFSGCDRGLRASALRVALLASGATLNACPQLRDADFEALPGDPLTRPDSGAGETGGSGGTGGPGAPVTPRDAGVPPDESKLRVQALRAALAHRFSFDGTGAVARDSIAGRDATLVGAALEGGGSLSLDGQGYVDLPNGVLSAANEQTIEAWLTWNGGGAWQRVFDFGSSDAGEGERGNGRTYLFLTPRSSQNVLLLAYSAAGFDAEVRLNTDVSFPVGVPAHVTAVIDSPRDSLSLYLDGRWLAQQTLSQRLSQIDDVNCWLGMAQYRRDPGLNASLTEFRLYHRALTGAEIELSHALGPDASL